MPDEWNIETGGHERAHMRIIGRALREGWDIPSEIMRALPRLAAKFAIDDGLSARDRLRAMELLRALYADLVGTALDVAKLERFDERLEQEFEAVAVRVLSVLEGSIPAAFVPAMRARLLQLGNGHAQTGGGDGDDGKPGG